MVFCLVHTAGQCRFEAVGEYWYDMMMLVFNSEHFFFLRKCILIYSGPLDGRECLVRVGMFIEMYGDASVVAPHLGGLDEVIWMRGHNLCLSWRC